MSHEHVINCNVFTAQHGMQTRSSDEKAVRPSVCQMRGLLQNVRKICPDIYTVRKCVCVCVGCVCAGYQ